MGLIAVTFYKGVCDHEGCDADPMEDSEYAAWQEADQVIQDAQNSDWYVLTKTGEDTVLLCPEHAPVCKCTGCDMCSDGCKVRLLDDEFEGKCEDCFLEVSEP